MLALRFAFALLLAGLWFMHALELWLPALFFYGVGIGWTLFALWQIADEEGKG